MSESEDYYRGKAAGIRELTWPKCDECGQGYDPEREELGKPWFHEINGKKKKCKAQIEWNHIDVAQKEAHRTYLTSRYGSMWQMSYRKDKDAWLDDKCYCCHKKATQRIDVNCWGVVSEVDVCDEHAERYDGKNCDMVLKREEPETADKCSK